MLCTKCEVRYHCDTNSASTSISMLISTLTSLAFILHDLPHWQTSDINTETQTNTHRFSTSPWLWMQKLPFVFRNCFALLLFAMCLLKGWWKESTGQPACSFERGEEGERFFVEMKVRWSCLFSRRHFVVHLSSALMNWCEDIGAHGDSQKSYLSWQNYAHIWWKC